MHFIFRFIFVIPFLLVTGFSEGTTQPSHERTDCTLVSTDTGFQKYTHSDNTANCFIFNPKNQTFDRIKLGLFSTDGVNAYAAFQSTEYSEKFYVEKGGTEYTLDKVNKAFNLNFWSDNASKYVITTSWLILNDRHGSRTLYVIADYSLSLSEKLANAKDSESLSKFFQDTTIFSHSNVQPHPQCDNDNTSPKNPNNHLWNLHQNVSDANDMLPVLVISPVTGLLWFANQVRENGEWDIKRFYPRNIDAENYGNFHYGATGAALGLPIEILQRAAGAVQELVDLQNGNYRPELDTWFGDSPYGDEHRDQEWIVKGFNYYHEVYDEAGELVDSTRDLCNLNNEIGNRYLDSSSGSGSSGDSGGVTEPGQGSGDGGFGFPSCEEITGTGCSCGGGSCVCDDQTIYECGY